MKSVKVYLFPKYYFLHLVEFFSSETIIEKLFFKKTRQLFWYFYICNNFYGLGLRPVKGRWELWLFKNMLLLKKLFVCSVCACISTCVPHVYSCPQGPEDGDRLPWNWIQVVVNLLWCGSSARSPGHLSSLASSAFEASGRAQSRLSSHDKF